MEKSASMPRIEAPHPLTVPLRKGDGSCWVVDDDAFTFFKGCFSSFHEYFYDISFFKYVFVPSAYLWPLGSLFIFVLFPGTSRKFKMFPFGIRPKRLQVEAE